MDQFTYKKSYKTKFTTPSCTYTHRQITITITMATTFEIPKSPSSQVKIVLHYLDLVKVLNLDELDKLFTERTTLSNLRPHHH